MCAPWGDGLESGEGPVNSVGAPRAWGSLPSPLLSKPPVPFPVDTFLPSGLDAIAFVYTSTFLFVSPFLTLSIIPPIPRHERAHKQRPSVCASAWPIKCIYVPGTTKNAWPLVLPSPWTHCAKPKRTFRVYSRKTFTLNYTSPPSGYSRAPDALLLYHYLSHDISQLRIWHQYALCLDFPIKLEYICLPCGFNGPHDKNSNDCLQGP